MSLPPADWAFHDEEEDRKRRAAIEEMMRSERERYFREEPVQQEYRDILDRMADRQAEAETAARTPSMFELKLEQFLQKRTGKRANADTVANPKLQFASLGTPAGVSLPDDGAGDVGDHFSSDAMLNLAAKATGFNQAKSSEGQSGAQQPYRVAQSDANQPISAGAQSSGVKTVPVEWPIVYDGVNRTKQNQMTEASIRTLPLVPAMIDQLNYAASQTNLGVEVASGGQVSKSESEWAKSGGAKGKQDRVGNADRHDDGHAGDVDLYEIRNGTKYYLDSSDPKDRSKMAEFIRHVVIAGANGIGHGYMRVGGSKTRRIHIGGGSVKAWGDGVQNGDPFRWVEQALHDGVAERNRLLKADAWPDRARPPQDINTDSIRLRDAYTQYWTQPADGRMGNYSPYRWEGGVPSAGPAWQVKPLPGSAVYDAGSLGTFVLNSNSSRPSKETPGIPAVVEGMQGPPRVTQEVPRFEPKDEAWSRGTSGSNGDERLSLIRRMLDNYREWMSLTK